MLRAASIFLTLWLLLWSLIAASGARAITTSNGHPYLTNYTAGPMAGYQVQGSLDGNGRRTGVQVVRNGSPVHTLLYGMNGDSGENVQKYGPGGTLLPTR